MRSVASARLAVLLVLGAGLAGCRSTGAGSDEGACRAACARLTEPGCDRPGLGPAAREGCEVSCNARRALVAQAGCQSERRRYLDCVARQGRHCASARCSASVCLEQGEGLAGCADEHDRYLRCIGPCLDVGSSQRLARRVNGREVKAELVRAGCDQCGKLSPGAPAGAPCQSHSVCAQVCCPCPQSKASVKVRACVDGSCANAEDACASARAAAEHDPCQLR